MAKYIKCDCCGKKIYIGDTVYYGKSNDYYELMYCSEECFLKECIIKDKFHEELIEYFGLYVYDIEKIAQRKADIELEIQKLQNELKWLED